MAFCPDHWSMVGGVVYCRRHAGTILAMGPGVEPAAMPELDNRGPSLVGWVADEISAEVMGLLRAAATTDETVVTNGDVVVVYGHSRRRRYERSWKLMQPRAIALKVSLTVTEGDEDAVVELRVGSNIVARGVPPWIARRRAGLAVGGQVDADQRDLFHRFFVNHVAEAVTFERAADRSLIA